ncbi:MAG: class A beta-lactamase, partial [Muribaculaceae bacterium]|nr:class A beta-lactamase [Muribaculaceae bacterium]
ARIGVAVIVNGKDTVSVNGRRDFPMQSVYKFPQAIAVADYCQRTNLLPNDTVRIAAGELRADTWSPMRDRYGQTDLSLPLSEILAYSVQQSDNNACDVLFRLIGGPQAADSLMKRLGFNDIHILNTEAEMHADPYLCYANRATPVQMAALFDRFYRQEMCRESAVLESVGNMMMQCNTGANRLPLPLLPTNALIGHKTGTGDTNTQGRITAINDAGYVFMPDGQGYAIAVFIADSGHNMSETEKMIADISEIVFKQLMRQQ